MALKQPRASHFSNPATLPGSDHQCCSLAATRVIFAHFAVTVAEIKYFHPPIHSAGEQEDAQAQTQIQTI